jgi:prepilin-type N-terminal cleavage/methylation domain-containing protein
MKDQQGFTLLELLISITIIGILAVTISDFYSQRLVDFARNFTLTILQSNTKQAVESVSRDIRASRTIEATNTLADASGPGGNQFGWHSTVGSTATLVLGIPAQDANGNLIYVDPGTHNTPYLNNVIYYLNGANKILYRRMLANTNAPSNAAVTTGCSGCPTDGKVIEDVANMSLAYYDGSGSSIATPSASYSLDITLQQTRTSFGRTFVNTLTSRVTLRNKP